MKLDQCILYILYWLCVSGVGVNGFFFSQQSLSGLSPSCVTAHRDEPTAPEPRRIRSERQRHNPPDPKPTASGNQSRERREKHEPSAGGPLPSARPSCPAPCPAPPVPRAAGGRRGSRRWGPSSAAARRVWARPGRRPRSEPSPSAPAGTASPTWSWSGSSRGPGEPSEEGGGAERTVGNASVRLRKREEGGQDEESKEAAKV